MNRRSKAKKTQYNILSELYNINLIGTKLLREISNNIESVFNNTAKLKTDSWLHLTEHVEQSDQLMVVLNHQMLGKMYGSRFLSNSFFKGLTEPAVVELLNSFSQIRLQEGEFIYHSHQAADKSSSD